MHNSARVLHIDGEQDATGADFHQQVDDRIGLITATSASEALDLLEGGSFDGIVSTFDLPGKNGLELLDAVRDECPELPFILLTEDESEIGSEAIAAGVTDIRSTDVEPELLAKQITRLTAESSTNRFEKQAKQSPAELLARISDAFIALDTEWQFTYVNDPAEEVFGMSASELLGKNIWNLYPEATDTPFYDQYHDAMTEGKPRAIEEYFESWDCWYREHIYPAENGLSVLFRDITGQKDQQRRLEAIFNNTYTFVGLMDPDGTLLEANDTALSFGGVERETVVGKPIWEAYWFQAGEDARTTAKEAVEQARDGELYRDEIRVQGADREAVIDFSVRPVTNESGAVELLVPEGRDITARKQALEELREQREFTEQALDTLGDIFYVVGTDGELRRWNSRLPEVTGYAAEEIEGMNAVDFFPEEERERIADAIETTLTTGETIVESELLTSAGDRIPYEFTGTRLTDAAGTLTGLVGTGRDMTDRKRYEDRIAGLNSVLTELLAAENEQAACQTTMQSAETTLDLPVSLIALFDDEQSSFRVVSRTEKAQQLDEQRLLGEEGPVWQSFTSGERSVVDLEDSTVDGETIGIEQLVVSPLGRHGVLVTGSRSSNVSDPELEFRETVGEKLRSALDRVERETLLREREEKLEKRNEQLTQINRINDIIRRIDRKLVAATSREEIEQSVCEQLAASGPYLFGWIGKYDTREEKIEIQAQGGDSDGYLDTFSLIFPDSSEDFAPDERDSEPSGTRKLEPGLEAIRTGEPQVVESIRTEPPYEQWREAALKRGCNSVISLPLVYRDRLYGVLSLYASQPDLVSELEREVLTELGESIGHAINAIEIRRALVSDRIVELTLSVPVSEIPFLEAIAQQNEYTFSLETIAPSRKGTYRVVFTARGVPPQQLIESMEDSPKIKECELVASHSDSSQFRSLVGDESFITWLLDHGAIPRSITATEHEGQITVHLPEEENVREFVESLQSRYDNTELLARYELEHSGGTRQSFKTELEERLTARQEELFRLAYSSGYFESPREQNASEVADTVGISQPTFTNHIRASQRKLLELLYDEETDRLDE